MAELTKAGIDPRSLTAIRDDLRAAFQQALGDDLRTDEESPQGQLIGILAIAIADAEALAVWNAAGLSIHTAQGDQLDKAGSLMGVSRLAGQRSTVTATFTGTPGTGLPKGTRAQTENGSVFRTTVSQLIGASQTVDVLMEAVEVGPVQVAAGLLTQRVDAIPGWRAITNAQAAAVGRSAESDAEYRKRYLLTIAKRGGGYIESIKSALLDLPGVTSAIVRDNITTADAHVKFVRINAGTIFCATDGGNRKEIANTILRKKPAGVPTSGDDSENAVYAGTSTTTAVRFGHIEELPLKIAATIDILAGGSFPVTGIPDIRKAITTWANGERGLEVGESIHADELRAAMIQVPGHHVQDPLSISLRDGIGYYMTGADPATLRFNFHNGFRSVLADAGNLLPTSRAVGGLAFVDDVLYAIARAETGNSFLLTISTATGVVTASTDMGRRMEQALTTDGTKLYGIDTAGYVRHWAPATPATQTALPNKIATGVTNWLGLHLVSDETFHALSDTSIYTVATATGAGTLVEEVGNGLTPRTLFAWPGSTDTGLVADKAADAVANGIYRLAVDASSVTATYADMQLGVPQHQIAMATTDKLPTPRLTDILTIVDTDIAIGVA